MQPHADRILTAHRRSSSLSDIDGAEIAKLPRVFFKPPKRRRGKDRPSFDEGKRRRGPRIGQVRILIGAMQCVLS
jgi:hypothetical protein